MRYIEQVAFFLLLPIIGQVLATSTAYGRQLPDVAPVAWSSDAWSDLDDNLWGARIGVYRAVPLNALLPQTAPGSSIHVLRLEGGIQSDDGDVIGRFRLSGLDLDVQRGHRSVLLTVADYNRAGTMDLDATWFRVGFGPGLTGQRPRHVGRIAVQAFSGLVTRELGKSLYAPLPKNDRATTMLEGGIAGRATVSHATGWQLNVRGEYAVHSVQGDLRTYTVAPELTWQSRRIIHVSLYAEWFGAERLGVDHYDQRVGLRLHIRP